MGPAKSLRRLFSTVLVVAVAAAATVGVAPAEASTAVPAGFEATIVISGLNRPTNLEFASDGRVFITEQSGLVKVFDSVDDPTPTVVADLRDQTHAVDGRGMLGLALDPDFPATPHVYIMYAHDAPIGGTAPTFGVPGATNDECPNPPGPGGCVISGRISRLVLDGDSAVSETVILEDWCQEWTSHSIGDLAFDSSGALLATSGEGAFAGQPDWGQRSGDNGCGDPPIPHGGTDQDPATAEGGALRSQDLRTPGDPAGLSGTVIRIDKNTGAAHPDNPNAGDPDPNVARVVAYGLRNPYRATLRPGTDELWLGDVGWNDYEELNVVDDADNEVLNFGWPCYEGPSLGYEIGNNLCNTVVAEGPAAVEAPYWFYEQRTDFVTGGDGCFDQQGSLSALTFYEGGQYPNAYDGAFFFGDYSRRCVWSMLPGPDGRPDPSTAQEMINSIAVTDLEVGPQGDIYALNIFGGGGLGGTVVKLSYPEGDLGPTARLSVDVTSGSAPLTASFDASATTPGAPGDVLDFDWDFDGDGVFGEASGPTPVHVYPDEGRYTAQVRVTDQNGEAATASVVLFVGDPPTVSITAPAPGTSWIVDDILDFAGSAVDGQGSPIPDSELVWDLILHHCETLTDCHTHNLGTIEGVGSGSVLAPDHEYPSYIEIVLTATGPSGLDASAALEFFPQTADLTIDGVPRGVVAGFNGRPVITPSTNEVIVGSLNTVSAEARQIFQGGVFEFVRWSDDAPLVHDVTVAADRTVTVEYEEVPGTTIYLSSNTGGTVGGIPFRDEDLLAFDTDTESWSMAFDGSDVGLGGADIDAASVVDTDPFTVDLSFDAPLSVRGVGSVDDSDIVRFTGTGGDATSGTFELLIDASDLRLATAGEDLDGWAGFDGDYLFSTVGGFFALGLSGADEDAVLLSPTSTGSSSAGTLSLAFDGSDVGLASEDLTGLSRGPAGEFYGALFGSWNLGGLSGDRNDVFGFDGALGDPTSGVAELFFDGDLHGFGAEQIDALHVGPGVGQGPPPAVSDLAVSVATDPSRAAVGDAIAVTITVTNNGPDDADGVVAAFEPPAGLEVVEVTGCATLPCELFTVASGAEVVVTVGTVVAENAVGPLQVEASVSSSSQDPVPGNDADSATVDLDQAPVAVDDGPAPSSTPGDPFHVPIDSALVATAGSAEDLLANDIVGPSPAGIVSFGGGDLGGTVGDHPAGATVSVGDGGSLSVGADGGFTFTPEPGFVGSVTFDYRVANAIGADTASVVIRVGQPPTVDPVFYLSSTSGGSVGGVGFADEDIVAYDSGADTWTMVFDGSDVGVGGSDVDGFSIVSLDPFVVDLSFGAPRSLPGLGSIDDSDVVRFTGVAGPDTAGTWALRFDGSDVGLTADGEDVDAVDSRGGILGLSMFSGFAMNGVAGADEDAVEVTVSAFGPETVATGVLAFDGSDVGFGRDLVGLAVEAAGSGFYGAGQGQWTLAGVVGTGADVFRFDGALGTDTAGTAELVFDGSLHGYGAEQIDGLDVVVFG